MSGMYLRIDPDQVQYVSITCPACSAEQMFAVQFKPARPVSCSKCGAEISGAEALVGAIRLAVGDMRAAAAFLLVRSDGAE